MKSLLLVTTFFVALSFKANAITLDYGDLVGIWDTPNDNAAFISSNVGGLNLTELARNENKFYSEGLLNVPTKPTVFGYKSEPTEGLWAYVKGAKVDYLAVATTSHFALYGYNSPEWIGLWTTDAIAAMLNSAGEGMTHITAYTVSAVPLPAAAPLFASALALFGFINYRRKARKS